MDAHPPRVLLDMPRTATPIEIGGGMQAWMNSNGYAVVSCPYHADPEKDSWEWYNNARKGLRDDQFRREVMIDFTARGGQKVFPYLEQDKKKYLIPHRGEIPKNHTIVCGMDWGGRNPTAILWCAVNERGHFHVFSEFYKPSNPSEVARYLKAHPYFHRLTKIVVDPSIYKKDQHVDGGWGGLTSVGDMIEDLGVYQFERAVRDRVAGLERIKYLFRYSELEPNLMPYLTLSEECANTWKELTGLVYKDETPEQLVNRDPSEDVVKKRDHAFDALKYVTMATAVPSDIAERPHAHPLSLHNILEEMEDKDNEQKFEDMIL